MKIKNYVFIVFLLISLIVVSCTENTSPVAQNDNLNTSLKKGGGFDEFGYNYNARLFNGPADGTDRKLDGKVWGDPTFANDHLVMKWNDEWDRGKSEGWLNPPYKAWTTNEWNGKLLGGSGQVWHYKIIWVGPELENSKYWKPGGYPIWGQFETIMDQGSDVNEHFWFAHAKSNGLIVK